MIATSPFGITNQQVTVVGLGGEGVLRTYGREAQAWEVIQEALAGGISYFDSARVYSDSEVYYGSVWGSNPGDADQGFFKPANPQAEIKREH